MSGFAVMVSCSTYKVFGFGNAPLSIIRDDTAPLQMSLHRARLSGASKVYRREVSALQCAPLARPQSLQNKQADLGSDSLGHWTIRMPRLHAPAIRAEHVGDHKCIVLVRVTAGLAIALAGTLDGIGRNDENMGGAARAGYPLGGAGERRSSIPG
jgi:hypothetical protein